MNKVPFQSLFRLFFASVLILLSVSSVKAETTNCTEITGVPVIITVQGVYCFKAHIATSLTSGNAIEIQTNNVTIDFNHFKLGGLAAGAATNAYGVYALNRKNITLRNANIRGFYYGVHLDDSSPGNDESGGHIIEDSRFDGNRELAIWVEGAGNSVRHNQILNTGGSTIIGSAFGIFNRGPGTVINDNHVHNTFTSTTIAVGIWLKGSSDAALVLHNRVSETTSTGEGAAIGISRDSGSHVLIQGNQIVNANETDATAIKSVSAAECLAVNNTLINFTTFIDTCTDGGGNTSF